jgi:broad specificity phosphatase PhoE
LLEDKALILTLKEQMTELLKDKEIIFIRHGKTESNEYEEKHRWGTTRFKDPQLWDTYLSARGQDQAASVRRTIEDNKNKDANYLNPFDGIELLVSSPLRRALNTAEIIFSDTLQYPSVNRVALNLAAERLYFSADVGRPKKDLEQAHPTFCFDMLPDDMDWWYSPSADELEKLVEWRPYPELAQYACPGEPAEVFRQRMGRLKEWLLSRTEQKIVVVTHWGVIRALTGRAVHNCDVVPILASNLLCDFLIDTGY